MDNLGLALTIAVILLLVGLVGLAYYVFLLPDLIERRITRHNKETL